MTTGTVAVQATDALTLDLDGGTTIAHNMGCDIVIVDQRVEGRKAVPSIVLTKANLEALLALLS